MAPHDEFRNIGKTVEPVLPENMEDYIEMGVRDTFCRYRMLGTTNSMDFGLFHTESDEGIIYVDLNPGWLYQFHPDEWPAIEQYLDESPFVVEFGGGLSRKKVMSQKNWDRRFSSTVESLI